MQTAFKEHQFTLARHDLVITSKLVEEQFMRDTIKGYLHDFEIVLKYEQTRELDLIRSDLSSKGTAMNALMEKIDPEKFVKKADYRGKVEALESQILRMQE
jgi:tRNA isopentenyl-2-thiomethyl-A-37 hydroxylase MiaE